jgi:dihydrofolate reductase
LGCVPASKTVSYVRQRYDPQRADALAAALAQALSAAAVNELKQQDGRDLIMYGYGRLNQTLLEHHLVDEIRFSVHPVLAGFVAGRGNATRLPLKLLGAIPSPSGVVALTYRPASS